MNAFVDWVLDHQEVLLLDVAMFVPLGVLLTRRGRHHR